jgi:arabinoxylan arabinofuranohydrolase
MNKINLFLLVSIISVIGYAQNPIVQTYYTADPAPLVYENMVYLYTTHDHDTAKTFFRMYDWKTYSSSDMVNWTDHGTTLSLEDFTWADDRAWAAQTVFRNGKFYFYICAHHQQLNQMAIGVAVSDSPTGPFKDAIGKPLITQDWGDIDPTVLIDDDGQAYMYWGNPQLQYVKLNEDMISYDQKVGIVKVPVTPESFGLMRRNEQERGSYVEGPWLSKHNDLYYLIYPAGGIPEYLAYSTSKSPTGPWVYQDKIMNVIKEGGAFTNHPGVIDYKGKSYLFYHNGALPGGGGFTRSVCLDEFTYNPDGSIPLIMPTKQGVSSTQKLNPFVRVEAETIAFSDGVKSYRDEEVGVFITAKKNGAYTKLQDVDFGKGAKNFTANVGTTNNGGASMEIRIDAIDGQLIGKVEVPLTGLESWTLRSIKLEKVSGVHDVYFVFKGSSQDNILFFDYWKFSK